jgi:hypothetical protein
MSWARESFDVVDPVNNRIREFEEEETHSLGTG